MHSRLLESLLLLLVLEMILVQPIVAVITCLENLGFVLAPPMHSSFIDLQDGH